ncbi:hypothetical protein ACTXT7_005990 [Hymenolepis weldensis]
MGSFVALSGLDASIPVNSVSIEQALVPGPDRRPPIESASSDASGVALVDSAPASPTSDEGTSIATGAKTSGDATPNYSEGPPKPVAPEVENVLRHRHHGFKSNGGNMKTMVDLPDPAGRIRLTMHYDVNTEILAVTVESAEYVASQIGLVGLDKDGLSDPYVKLSVVDGLGHTVGDSKKTKPVKNDLNPQFDERYSNGEKFGEEVYDFEFSVKSEILDTCKLCVDVKNHVGVLQCGSQTRDMGSVVLNLKALKNGVAFTEWQV